MVRSWYKSSIIMQPKGKNMLCPDRLNPHDFPSPCFVTDLCKTGKEYANFKIPSKKKQGQKSFSPSKGLPSGKASPIYQEPCRVHYSAPAQAPLTKRDFPKRNLKGKSMPLPQVSAMKTCGNFSRFATISRSIPLTNGRNSAL